MAKFIELTVFCKGTTTKTMSVNVDYIVTIEDESENEAKYRQCDNVCSMILHNGEQLVVLGTRQEVLNVIY